MWLASVRRPALSLRTATALVWLRRLVNSAVHIWGKQVYKTGDEARNNPIVALLVFGERFVVVQKVCSTPTVPSLG